ncbi:hypothetical protein ACFPES_19000 [Paenibacillus sp. GCM10023248]|uniref:hypothetical protein n=1 Tax=unclassified Paenibacillus TaxID=185978 RepID=UPI0023781234|nr:hypothetical protein [Paenibacillus sp. MAHUQ-63]MDD9269138.1 hypothetical protein [Paenibacillus sp. MAHUQ-63]
MSVSRPRPTGVGACRNRWRVALPEAPGRTALGSAGVSAAQAGPATAGSIPRAKSGRANGHHGR